MRLRSLALAATASVGAGFPHELEAERVGDCGDQDRHGAEHDVLPGGGLCFAKADQDDAGEDQHGKGNPAPGHAPAVEQQDEG